MLKLKHRFVGVNGIRLHTVEAGEGTLVLLVHGFPELWYSWRHQFAPLVEAGYRVVAYDQRGFGQSSKIWDPDAYTVKKTTDDAIALIEAMGEKSAIIIGHDWGAPVAWSAAWLYPEKIDAVLGLSVPFAGRGVSSNPLNVFGEHKPSEAQQRLAGAGQDFYMAYFGGLRAVIDEIEIDSRRWHLSVLRGFSAEPYDGTGIDPTAIPTEDIPEFIRNTAACVPHGKQMLDRMGVYEGMPSWLAQEDFDFYANEFERTGYAGGLSYYRAIDQSWAELEPWVGKPVRVPAAFLGGQFDAPTLWGRVAIERAGEYLPELIWQRVIPGAGHWLQQEKPAETNAAILDFLRAVK